MKPSDPSSGRGEARASPGPDHTVTEAVFRITGGQAITEQRVAIGAQDDGGFDTIVHRG